MRKTVAATALLVLTLSSLATPAQAADTTVTIDLLSVNDFHGRLEAAPPIAGAAVLAGMVDSYRAANPNTVFVGAGDLIGASTFTSFIQHDQPTIDALNAMGLDASAFGNHEFDQGRADVDNRILPAADWDYLSANIYDRATGAPAYQEYSLQTFGDVTIGFIGAMTEELPSLVSPGGISTLEVRPVVPEVNRVADALSDGDTANGEADVVVLLVHEGAATTSIASATDDSPFGQIVTGADANVDAIISGHTHLAYDHEIPIPGTDRLRPVFSSGQYGEKFAHSTISVDPATGELLSFTVDVLPLAGAYAPNAAVASIVSSAAAVATELGKVKVGDITAAFNRAKQTSAGSENRGGESTLGNFVADVQLWATQDAGSQIALMNPGGLRANLAYASTSATDPAGNVTFAEAAAVQPFANTLVTMTLTGAQLKRVLEEQWQPAGSSRPFLKLGVSKSLRYTYDPAGAAGDRIDAIYLNGALVTAADSVTVTVNSFLATGGDNFATLATGTNVADSGKIDLQSMVDYFQANPVASPDYAQRSVGVSLSAPDADGYSAGDSVTLSLSSLLFSNGEPNAGTAVVSAGAVELGSAVIDPAIVDTKDEVGRATVTVTIPEGTPAGTLVLTVSVPETGTTIDVPITVTETVEVVTAPTITGTGTVGRTLSVSTGTWSVASPTLTYQWNRNGTAIAGATATTYTLTAADAGASITVTVTASAEGYTPASVQTAGKQVAKLATLTLAVPSRLLLSRAQTVDYRVYVLSAGATVSGAVSIYDNGVLVGSAQLSGGTATVPLSGLSRGVHRLTAQYAESAQFGASRSFTSYVLVI